jgi:hypothetical protein
LHVRGRPQLASKLYVMLWCQDPGEARATHRNGAASTGVKASLTSEVPGVHPGAIPSPRKLFLRTFKSDASCFLQESLHLRPNETASVQRPGGPGRVTI